MVSWRVRKSSVFRCLPQARVAGAPRRTPSHGYGALAALVALSLPVLGLAQQAPEPVPEVSPERAAPLAVDRAPEGARFTVGAGDSWMSMRARICPVESIQAANPALMDRTLREGDRIVAPFVPVAELERANEKLRDAARRLDAARTEAEARSGEAAATIAQLSARLEELENIAAERDDAVSQRATAWGLLAGAGVVSGVLLLGIGALGVRLLAVQRGGAARDQRLRDLDAEYTDLRRSLNDLDLQLQRRMLQLVSWHDTRGLTERQIAESAAPVLDLARKLKERHAG